ncbi:hypothetical protein NDU88_006789 [Pleurodeles waltl]|uniref:Uncharacterized protein n=1 Tax=Pleurodeles waltl TaxID=8319 RepID=A0AAV7UP41_PLEWA|nr:hypothetical protein NDU88_006789 [Pleurodeles waltl]
MTRSNIRQVPGDLQPQLNHLATQHQERTAASIWTCPVGVPKTSGYRIRLVSKAEGIRYLKTRGGGVEDIGSQFHRCLPYFVLEIWKCFFKEIEHHHFRP